MFRTLAAALAVFAMVAPAGVAAAAEGAPVAAVEARPLTQGEVKILTERLWWVSTQLDDLQQKLTRATRAAYKRHAVEASGQAPGAATDYRPVVITNTNGLAGYSGVSMTPATPAQTQRVVKMQQQIGELVRERDLIRARLAQNEAGR